MADVDVYQLLSLIDELNKNSKIFSDAASSIIDQAKKLDKTAQSLFDNANTWAGKGSTAFQTVWIKYHGNTINAALTLDGIAQALSKLASQLNNHAQNILQAQATAEASMVLTGWLLVADIVQLGLDPVTDTATGVSGAASVELETQIANEEAAIAEIDTQVSTELDTVTNQIVDSTQLDQLDLPTTDLNELEQIEGNLTKEEQKLSDPSTETDFIPDEPVQGGGFPEDQRLPYDPPGEVFEQQYDGSCIAACCKMVLSDGGVEQPEAYIRTAAEVDAQEGGYLSNVPDALDALGSPNNYTYETNMTLNQLEDATAGGKSAIVSMSLPQGGLHAIVVDGVQDGMVLIRDPAGEAYEVTRENFLKLWGGKAIIPTP